MAKVAVMTDSVACIPQDKAAEYNIRVIPAANIMINGSSYIDGETITPKEAYRHIKEDPDRFMTSAIQPEYILKVYRELAKKADHILFVTISSALSAVSRTADIATKLLKEESPDTGVSIYDSRACASTQGLVVLAAAKAAMQGKGPEEVEAAARKTREAAGGVMMLDTLRYVYRTGRMSKMAARFISLLNIKPINIIDDQGKLEMLDRTRNTSEGLQKLVQYIAKQDSGAGLHFMITHADAEKMARDMQSMLEEKFSCLSMLVSDYSPVMGYGAGPGAIFVGYHPEIA